MIQIADLHTHSTASDGQYTPSELVQLAKARGIEVLAITDHDTIDGLEEAAQAGRWLGVRVFPGIELSAKEYDTFHILGYGIEPNAPALQALCHRMKRQRDERNPRLISFLKEKGVTICLEDVKAAAGGSIIGRPHFAQAMVRQGYAATNREAFDLYLDTEEYHQKVDRGKPSVQECIKTIHAAGGKVSLAHPYQIGLSDGELDHLVRRLKALGLDAIECYYPKYTLEQQTFYLHLTEKYRLHQTGGSDFHGEKVKPEVKLAAMKLELSWLTAELETPQQT